MRRKWIAAVLALVLGLLCACAAPAAEPDAMRVAATTYPVWQFTCAVAEGTGLTVERLVTEPVSCLHDYSLSVEQMKKLERSSLVVISGMGLEDFMADVLPEDGHVIDASEGIAAICAEEHEDGHGHHGHDHGHDGADPHIWLDPARAAQMVQNICAGLSAQYPEYKAAFEKNAGEYCERLGALTDELRQELSELSCRELVTFHDGFSYFAEAFGLSIAAAMEVEAGSEAPAGELEEIVRLIEREGLPAVFVEQSGDDAAASIVAAETGVTVGTLDMGMSERDYFSAMRQNMQAIKGALG